MTTKRPSDEASKKDSKVSPISMALVDGPSADRIIDAFRYALDESAHVYICFRAELEVCTMPEGHPGAAVGHDACNLYLKPICIEHENGSGHSFNLEGCIESPTPGGIGIIPGSRFWAYYNAQTHEGSITICPQ